VQVFSNAFAGAAAAMSILEGWAGEAVRLNLCEIGRGSEARVSLPEYLEQTRTVVDRAERFREMCLYLNWAGRKGIVAG
jgi:hypothetical protein